MFHRVWWSQVQILPSRPIQKVRIVLKNDARKTRVRSESSCPTSLVQTRIKGGDPFNIESNQVTAAEY